jgi:S1-C subfamily serine protease
VVTVAATTETGNRLGAGFVVAGEGLVLCASQTLEGATHVEVKLGDGPWRAARVVARDDRLRAGLLWVEHPADELWKAVAVAPKAVLQRQAWVVAVDRSPDGKTHPVTGLVTDVGAAENGRPAVALTDAPAAPGGPLVNLLGEVVGMSLGKISPRRGRATAVEPLKMFVRNAAAQLGGASQP